MNVHCDYVRGIRRRAIVICWQRWSKSLAAAILKKIARYTA